MDWNGLRTFLRVVETGSLSAAAKDLGVNHSTVYRRIQSLEEIVGGKLLELQGQRYVLTAMGEEFSELGQEIELKYNEIERRIVGKEFQPKGTVRITAPYNIANRYLPSALASIRDTYPDIRLEILSSNQEVNMNSRLADIAVRATHNPPEHLIGRKVATFSWGLFVSPGFINKHGSDISIEGLNEHCLIGGAGGMMNLPAFAWLEKHYAAKIAFRCDELTAMSYLAESDLGVALLPMDQEREGLVCVHTVKHITPSDIWLLTHPDLKKTERIRIVMRALSEYFSSLSTDSDARK